MVTAGFLDVAEGGDSDVTCLAVERLSGEAGECLSETDLDEELLGLFEPECYHGPVKSNRFAQMFRPVGGIGRFPCG